MQSSRVGAKNQALREWRFEIDELDHRQAKGSGLPGAGLGQSDKNRFAAQYFRNRFFQYGREVFKSKVIDGPEDILFQSKCAKIHSVSFEGRLQKHLE